MTITHELILQDEDGNQVRAYTLIPERKHQTIDGKTEVTFGLPAHHLYDGGSLNENKDGTFTVVQTGKILRKV